MQSVPKATTNHKNKKLENDSGVDFLKSKSEVIKEAGFTPKQVERFQQLAANPELIEEAKAEARANDDIVSRSAVKLIHYQENLFCRVLSPTWLHSLIMYLLSVPVRTFLYRQLLLLIFGEHHHHNEYLIAFFYSFTFGY